jgi:hypothetical protein
VEEPTPTPVPVWSVWTDKWGIDGVMTSSAFPDMQAVAKPIFVAYQASDQDLLASVTLSSNSSIPTPTSASTTGNSLSGGTIAGIVVGSAAGGVLAALLFFFSMWFCLGFRFTRKRAGGSMTSESHHELAAKEASTTAQLDSQPKSNSSQCSATELSSAREIPPELDTSYGRYELAGARDSKS